MGVELFQIDSYDPKLAGSSPADPIQLALGILGGELDPSATASCADVRQDRSRCACRDSGRHSALTIVEEPRADECRSWIVPLLGG